MSITRFEIIQNDSIAILFVSNPCNDMDIKTTSNDTSNNNNNKDGSIIIDDSDNICDI